MAINTYHLRSSVKGKEPTPGTAQGQLPLGSIAINFHEDEPFLSIQDSAGQIRRIAGVKIGNAAPATATAGEFWLDTSGASGILKIFDGTVWVATGTPVADATTSAKGVVQLADAAAVTAGTAGRAVTADQLKDTNDNITTLQGLTADASETVKGIVELATAAETTAGTDNTRAVHPAGLKVELDKKAPEAPDGGTDGTKQYVRQVVTTGGANTKTWVEATQAAALWSRTGTTLSPANDGDSVHLTSGGVAGVSLDPGSTSSPLVRDSNGRLGVGTATPTTPIQATGIISSTGGIGNLTAEGAYMYYSSNEASFLSSGTGGNYRQINFGQYNGTSERKSVAIDPDGRLLVGANSATGASKVVLQGNSAQADGIAILRLQRDRPLLNGNDIGQIDFGTPTDQQKALMYAAADGNWTSGTSTPSRFTFWTTPNGSTTPVERMRINALGQVVLPTDQGMVFTDVDARLAFAATPASIGRNSIGSGTNALFIGNAQIQTTSDKRLKKDVVDTALDATEELKRLRVVDFTWDDPNDTSFNNKNARGKWTGILAQELVEVFPFAVNAPRKEEDLSIDHDSDDIWTVNQDQLVPVLIKAFQEAMQRIEDLEAKVTALEGGSPTKSSDPGSKTRR